MYEVYRIIRLMFLVGYPLWTTKDIGCLQEKFLETEGEYTNMAKYRKKPVDIEAIQWNGINLSEIKEFVGDSLVYDIIDTAWQVGKGKPHVLMKIKTLEGDMEVSEKDFIIKGINGEYYPCKPDIFEKTYEEVQSEEVE